MYKQNIASDNVYAPFPSRLDWEIARWAKAHGTTLTAVLELLKIPGVNHNQIPKCQLLTCFPGYGKPWPVIQDGLRAQYYHRQRFTIVPSFSSSQSHHCRPNCDHLYAQDNQMHPSIVQQCWICPAFDTQAWVALQAGRTSAMAVSWYAHWMLVVGSSGTIMIFWGIHSN